MARQNPDLRKAREDPKAAFGTPERVLGDAALDRASKRAILESWERDARELAVAEEEGMGGGEQSMLQRVLSALEAVSDASAERAPAANAKHGGRDHGSTATPESTSANTPVRDRMRRLEEAVHMDQDLEEAAVRMRKAQVPFLPVVDGDEIVGILSARDLDAAPQQTERGSEPARARDHLSGDVAYCFEDDDLETAKSVMDESGHHRLLVVDREGILVGLITLEAIAGDVPAGGAPPHAGPKAGRRHVDTRGRAKGETHGRLVSYGVKPRIKR